MAGMTRKQALRVIRDTGMLVTWDAVWQEYVINYPKAHVRRMTEGARFDNVLDAIDAAKHMAKSLSPVCPHCGR